MSTQMEQVPIEEYDNPDAALMAATRASTGIGVPMVGVFFTQGQRRFVATSLPVETLVEHVKAPKYKLRGKPYDVLKEHNRPLIKEHRDKIRDYLLKEEVYILPPILLNSTKALKIYGIKGEWGASRTCYFVLPHGESLYVTDGQHRIAGLPGGPRGR